MKKLGIDARLYRQTGVGVYVRNLLYYLGSNLPSDVQVYIYLTERDFDTASFKEKNFIKRKANFQWHTFSEQTGFLKTILADNLDLMHFTYFSYPILYRRSFISTVHDLTPYLFKTGRSSTKNILLYKLKHFFFTRILKSQIKNAKAIITPTQAVKNQILKHFSNKYEKKIHAIYEGLNEELLQIKENTDLKKSFSEDFMVYIGNFYPHKNVERLIKAFTRINKDIQLVLAGPDDFFARRIQRLIIEFGQTKRIIFYKNPTLSDLVFFYKHAKALINPSLSEGFGLPMIEALYYNCPILGSDIEVFQEVLNKNYRSFDPYNDASMSYAISSFLEKPTNNSNKELLKKYSFEKMTKETTDLYKVHLNL
ncbi:hypothetical protein A3G67_04830 [Candidatus Roizmanbacteria bacterium RIFCSPLOWO2_12_FULL_40_12]|uniref:Glycosyl transferase family 1 domain-containing protein n=1 Tax=Candidatus Roizmanbacteria bacterium RIFCSPLOWO2_01_FULL_40_42 TaxID=1802066 RepID=A0A1F7J4K2_9BACT|nr:MAG: hypothetical protein A2779_04320 [Candidatus Roizmanbacteria bacterium RIFCSPHIGHO2_01_FULL_40_98]OGK27302.1 MAG: hypothetical protein A3C31_04645 [Candidatus Roizmanbacteria bacterium RIFCSPHIGHO2_02_FULL_40_53]OGK30826.1 MAG: hypothetical protein A2W49_02395 [Candidatus Roizmanbacteria bacterium RIFCSPHIGHO2_12_41_18]OGK36407.1 MAG: hypothetical protein A3E69_02270 [Candidatus Roizmanbacteria bacterium RIFCSPHIGHO2_12_FULL_40_130]OGK50535.1 MAG: hypothetical protein A3B50_02000 [Candi